jgi:hypothetical protein
MQIDREEIEILAYRLYKQDQPYDGMVWRLAELLKIIQMNIDLPEKQENWCDLNAFKTLGDLKAHLKNKTILMPTEDEVRPLAKTLYSYRPEKSKLHWFIAEKTLILEKLKDLISQNNL